MSKAEIHTDEMVRVEGICELAQIDLEGDKGPIKRLLMTFFVRPLIPGPDVVDVRPVHLVLDDLQFNAIRNMIGQMEALPQRGDAIGPTVQ